MKKLKDIKDLEIGDVIAEPILNSYGMLLLPGGTPISQGQIRMLQMWNIKSVPINMDINDYDSWLSDELIALGYEAFSNRISWKPNNPQEEDFFNLGVIFEARKYMLESAKRK